VDWEGVGFSDKLLDGEKVEGALKAIRRADDWGARTYNHYLQAIDAFAKTLTVRAACSKHRREDTLPMHPELVVMVRDWIAGMDADELLFPRLERKKTWLMVKKDLERIGIPYETPDGGSRFPCGGPPQLRDRAAAARGNAHRGSRVGPARRRADDDEVHPHRAGGPGRSAGRPACSKHMQKRGLAGYWLEKWRRRGASGVAG
jgi:hypothetical protein